MFERPDPGFPLAPAKKQFVIEITEADALVLGSIIEFEIRKILRDAWAGEPIGFHVWEVKS